MDIEARHALLRSKLDKLGFSQPLPIGSFAIVTALLNDLVLTTSSLKSAKDEISRLNEEKEAWDLGIEPYKCDNSKLLAECNALHLEIIKERDKHQKQIFGLNETIRKLRLDKLHLKEECKELNERVVELENQLCDPRHHKNQTNQALKNRKPFISTVRSGDYFSKQGPLSGANTDDKSAPSSPSKSSQLRRFVAIELEQNNVQSQAELIELYKSQIESRNREISRLNGLLVGGRPASALVKDCCYHGVVSLNTDIDALQRQKAEIHQKYEDTIRSQQDTINRTVYLTEKNLALAREMAELKEVALNAENDANLTLSSLHRKNTQLKAKLNDAKKEVSALEEKLRRGHKQKLMNEKTDLMVEEELERTKEIERELKIVIEKLTKKNSALKSKLSESKRSCECSRGAKTHEAATTAALPPANDYSAEVVRLKSDRDFFQQEYLKVLQAQTRDSEVERLRSELRDREAELCALRKAGQSHSARQKCRCGPTSDSVRSTVHRLEQDRTRLQESVDCLTNERNKMQKHLHMTTTTHCDQIARHEREIEALRQNIRDLQMENRDLQFMQGPSKSTIDVLKSELKLANAQISDLKQEIDKVRSTYQQLKSVHERTESALIERQSQLSHRSHQLKSAESCLGVADTDRCMAHQGISDLKAEIGRLKGINEALQREKDQLIIKLDNRTEQVHKLESKFSAERERVLNLGSEVASARQQLEFAHSEKHKSQDSLHHVSSEMDAYRQQISRLKRSNDNAMRETSRLTNELAESECKNCLMKTKLGESEKEIERLKSQLQQYVQEVQRAEELLLRKEEERDEMLDFYKTLSQDAVMLEGNNQSLELEAAETKRTATALESKLKDREIELESVRKRNAALIQKIERLEANLEHECKEKEKLRRELAAQKELCTKLDVEKEKLRAEVNEYAEIRRELEREIEKLHNDLLISRSDDKCVAEKLQTEIALLKSELADERKNAARSETLAKDYHMQLKELRRKLLDDRVQQSAKQLSHSNDRFSSF